MNGKLELRCLSGILAVGIVGCTLPLRADTPIVRQKSGNSLLVLATVSKSQEFPPDGIVYTLEIVHNYSPLGTPTEKSFEYHTSLRRQGSGDPTLSPPLEVGENVLWLITKSSEGVIRGYVHSKFGVDWPAREKASSRYKEAKEMAESMERISRLEEDKRLDELLRFVRDGNAETGFWAVKEIGEIDPDNIESLLSSIAESGKCSVGAMVAIDEIFVHRMNEKWIASESRRSFFSGRLKGKLSQNEGGLLLRRLDVAWQHSQIHDEDLRQFMQLMINNVELTLSLRQEALHLCGRAFQRSKNTEWFSFLAKVLDNGQDLELQRSAVHAIKNANFEMRDDQFNMLKGIRNKTTDHEVASVIDEIAKK